MTITGIQLCSSTERTLGQVQGFPMNSAMWEPQFEALSSAGFRALAPDFRGFGATLPRQPWFVEVGDIHGNGNLMVFADRRVSDLKTVTAAAGGK